VASRAPGREPPGVLARGSPRGSSPCCSRDSVEAARPSSRRARLPRPSPRRTPARTAAWSPQPRGPTGRSPSAGAGPRRVACTACPRARVPSHPSRELGDQLHRVLVVLPPLPEPMGLERQPDRLGELIELVELLVLVLVLPSQVSLAQGYARRAVHALKRLLGAHRGRASRERDPFRRRMGISCRAERFCSAPPRRNPTTRVPPRRPPRVYKPSR
jgi:hypothetical protein